MNNAVDSTTCSTSWKMVRHRLENGTVDSNENYKAESQQEKKKTICVKPQRGSRKPATLQDHQLPQFLREPYITSGYRDSDNITVRQCLATLFTIHNETFNIWSHLIAAVGFLVHCVYQLSKHDIIDFPAVYPILCYILATCLMLLSSSFAHLFSCISWRARHTCFYIDYAAISIFTFTAGQGFIFYCRPVTNDSLYLYKSPYIFLGISFCLSCINVILSCLSRHRFPKYRYIVRTGVCAMKFVIDSSPVLARCFVHHTCTSHSLYLFKRFILCYFTSGIVNASKLPERLFPGYFDLVGHSHHIFHVLLAIGNFDAFDVMLTDMVERKDVLSASPYPPTFFTTFGLLIVLTLFNSVVVVWFVRNWLTAEEEEELFTGSQNHAVYNYKTKSINNDNEDLNLNQKNQ